MAVDSDTRLSELTEAQKQVLRLVMAGFKSKEIAYQLGIGIDAVNKRLASAKATLGASSRFAAARLLAAAEDSGSYHSTVSQFLAVEPALFDDDLERATALEETRHDQLLHSRVEEPQAPYELWPTAPGARSTPRGIDLLWVVATPGRVFALAVGLGALIRLATRS